MSLLESTWSIFQQYYPLFFQGLAQTLKTAAIVVFFGTLLGIILALIKLLKVKPLNAVLSFLIEFLRGTPLLLQLYLFYFLPDYVNISISKELSILLALIINSSAYVSEIFRAGIQAVDFGQTEAALSLGLSTKNMYVHVIMPQAIRNILPALVNEFIMMIKETSLSSVFFIDDLMTSSKIVQSASYLSIEPLIIVGIIYFVVTSVLSYFAKKLERKWAA